MGIGWQLTRGVFAASAAASRTLSNAATQSAAQWDAQRGSSAVRRGMVGPLDNVPAGASDFLDYQGLALPRDIRGVNWAFPLGRYVLPKSSRFRPEWPVQDEIGVSAETANRHTVVYAPNGSGKTASIVVPWIYSALCFDYLVVAVDVKGNGDLLGQVNAYAAASGQGPLPDHYVHHFDYTDPARSVRWNWIADLVDDQAIEAAARALVGGDRENDPNREFRSRDLKWLRGLLELAQSVAAATSARWTVSTILGLLADQSRLARLVTNAAPQRAQNRLSDLVYLAPDEYDVRSQFLTSYLDVLDTDGLNQVTRTSGLRMSRLDDDPGLAIVTAPLSDGRLAQAVSGLFMSQFLTARLRRRAVERRKVLLVLDEAPRLQDRLDLAQILSTVRSAGVSVLLAVQEVTDLEEPKRETILSNCMTHILLPGAGSATTEYFGKRLGTRAVARQSTSSSYTSREGRSFQTSTQNLEIPVLGRTELANPPSSRFSAFVHCHELSHKPMLVDLTRGDL